jgi:SAM-dependent methyltransferase
MTANLEQATMWNEGSGRAWVEMQRVLDGVLEPVVAPMLDEAFPGEGKRVLDIGCGAGATTLAMAQRLGPSGQCVGVDISAPLVEVARARAAANTSFVVADAQTYAFEPATFDAVISRFGVMFFDDPVAAFANIRRATRRDGRLAVVTWRSPAENPFMTHAARVAGPLLPNPLPTPDPDKPGMFSLADPDRARRILAAAGWRDIDLQPLDAECTIAESDMLTYMTKLGPIGGALRTADDATRARVTDVLTHAFDDYLRDGAAHFTSACWLVRARSPE